MAAARSLLSPSNARQIFPRLAIPIRGPQSPMSPLLLIPFLSTYPSSSRYTGSVISSTVSSLLADIWDSFLRAVPKKKTSHMKKRHRQMAGKALKDTINVNKCPACGEKKRSHLLCPTCVGEVRQRWRTAEK